MTNETTRSVRRSSGRRARRPLAFAAIAAASVIGVLTAGTAAAATPASERTNLPQSQSSIEDQQTGQVARFTTEIQWGGPSAAWHADTDLYIFIGNRREVVSQGTALAGTQVSWTGPNGNAGITFTDNRTFHGTAQFPNEGPVGYRGTLVGSTSSLKAPARSAPEAAQAARFASDIQWGGDYGDWHPDSDTVIYIGNRREIVSWGASLGGTLLNWIGPNGNANIAFSDSTGFFGTAQFPNEGPVGYRGSAK
jgi:hypothetical protein